MTRSRFTLIAVAAALIGVALPARGAQFKAYDIVIDPRGQALAAYQVEIIAADPSARIVGVEGGEHTAFRKAPYYDPAALQAGRIVIAAFSTGADLPRQATNIATLHVMETDECDCRYGTTLMVAVDAEGRDIEVDLKLLPIEETHR